MTSDGCNCVQVLVKGIRVVVAFELKSHSSCTCSRIRVLSVFELFSVFVGVVSEFEL